MPANSPTNLEDELYWGFLFLFAATLKPTADGFRAVPRGPKVLLIDHCAAPVIAAVRPWLRDTWGVELPPGVTGNFNALGQVFYNVALGSFRPDLDEELPTNTVQAVYRSGSDAERVAVAEVERAVAPFPTRHAVNAFAICGRWESGKPAGYASTLMLKFARHTVRQRMVCMFPSASVAGVDLAAVTATLLVEQGMAMMEHVRVVKS
ncbi:MAG: hypothetical protein IPK16_33215 [Anaerolineales bacterium]|nr:hypothetical protein [Anaerolineales bacterium]